MTRTSCGEIGLQWEVWWGPGAVERYDVLRHPTLGPTAPAASAPRTSNLNHLPKSPRPEPRTSLHRGAPRQITTLYTNFLCDATSRSSRSPKKRDKSLEYPRHTEVLGRIGRDDAPGLPLLPVPRRLQVRRYALPLTYSLVGIRSRPWFRSRAIGRRGMEVLTVSQMAASLSIPARRAVGTGSLPLGTGVVDVSYLFPFHEVNAITLIPVLIPQSPTRLLPPTREQKQLTRRSPPVQPLQGDDRKGPERRGAPVDTLVLRARQGCAGAAFWGVPAGAEHGRDTAAL